MDKELASPLIIDVCEIGKSNSMASINRCSGFNCNCAIASFIANLVAS